MSEIIVAVLYPTRGRAEQAKARAGAMLAQPCPDGVRVVLVASVEKTDDATFEVMHELSEAYPGRVAALIREPGTTSVQGWNLAYAFAREGADWVVLGADDVEWLDGWLESALDAAERTGAAMVGLHDGHDKHRRYGPHYMARVSFLEEHIGGVVAVPHYQAWGFDYEISARADALGLYTNAPGTPIEHHHPVWGLSERDETYNDAWPAHIEDTNLRLQRAAQGYPTDYEPAMRGVEA